MQVHFIGIGEAILSDLALTLRNKGHIVTGSDSGAEESLKNRLEPLGLLPETMGWNPETVHDQLDAVILGANIPLDNPELCKAQELGLQIFSYPAFVFEQSKYKTRVVVAGHGKADIIPMILHVLHYHNVEVDYMMETPLEGFERRVHLTEENDFIILEGEEHFSSVMDPRPKFHVYQPNIALLGGIADETPTLENQVGQFRIFVDGIIKGGSITYNEEDPEVKKVVEATENPIRKFAYQSPDYQIENGMVLLDTPEGEMPLEISENRALDNLIGAKWICQQMGVDEDDFYEAVASFTMPAQLP
jgi:UDP-N-acetylmuramate: L-alanyl-gamma-D-glutamyl-meso-diaminopimelate ligase